MNFGSYFKNLRKSKHITQQQIATAIGKSKMLVSGVETNKNAPFIDEDLKFIVDVLSLSEEEERKLYKEAAKARGKLPKYLLDYLTESDEAYNLLEMCAKKNLGKDSLVRIMQIMEECN